jgi:uncharacterized Tic20 family protein
MQDPMFKPDSPYENPTAQNTPPNTLQGPPQTECVMAGLSHLSILLPQFGLFVPLILWLVNRDTAPFAAYQSQQAFWFQLAVTVGFWLVTVMGTVFGIFTLGLGFLALLPILALWHLLAAIYGIVGGVNAFQGRDFRYFILGDIVKPN